MFRKVIKTEFYSNKHCRDGEGSYIFTLECGHTKRQKKSGGKRKKVMCLACKNDPTTATIGK